MIIRVRAKVKRVQESDLELLSKDLGSMSWKEDNWVWTNFALRTDEIRNIAEYSQNKTLIQDYEGNQLLIAESFDSFCQRWEESEKDIITEDDLILDSSDEK
jgi:hypothetical protein